MGSAFCTSMFTYSYLLILILILHTYYLQLEAAVGMPLSNNTNSAREVEDALRHTYTLHYGGMAAWANGQWRVLGSQVKF